MFPKDHFMNLWMSLSWQVKQIIHVVNTFWTSKGHQSFASISKLIGYLFWTKRAAEITW